MTVQQQYGSNGSVSDQVQRGREEMRRLRSDAMGISDDVRRLAQLETELAKAEARESFSNMTRALIFAGVTSVLTILLLTFAFLTLTFAFDEGMDLWVAALLTTLIIGACTTIAGLMAYMAFKRIRVVPERTMKSLREDLEWASRQMSFTGR